MAQPHPDRELRAIAVAILTVSDTRTPATDTSGQLMQSLLTAAGHHVADYVLLPDEPSQIQAQLQRWSEQAAVEVILLNGGTGIAPRDTTYDAIAPLLNPTLPGFGELFRSLSYAEISSRALASRAIAGVYGHQLLFAMPGSSSAVRLAMEALILPELAHLLRQLRGDR